MSTQARTQPPPRPVFSYRERWTENIPTRLRDKDHWVLWRYEWDGKKKWTKVPYKVHKPRSKASTTDPQDWDSFHEAVRIYEKLKGTIHAADGVGYVFSHQDGLVGVDLDRCIEGGEVLPWARAYLDRLMPTYAEVTPSGTGLHLIVFGQLPGGGVKVGPGSRGPLPPACER